jgi:Zn-finger nucleic acid-binding protein
VYYACTGGRAMNCRNCGAAMQPVGGAAYFRCLHCGTFEFPKTTDEGVAAVGEASEFGCPVCKQPLGTAAIDGHPICYCGVCRGFLTTNPDFTAILLHRRARLGDQPAVPRSIDPAELRRRVGCPKCKKLMDTHPYGGGGNVVIDTCHRCHLVWLDAGEGRHPGPAAAAEGSGRGRTGIRLAVGRRQQRPTRPAFDTLLHARPVRRPVLTPHPHAPDRVR